MEALLLKKCHDLVSEKQPFIPDELKSNLSQDLLARLLERIVLKFASQVDDEVLKEINDIIEEDIDVILFHMKFYVDVDKLVEEAITEITKSYLKE